MNRNSPPSPARQGMTRLLPAILAASLAGAGPWPAGGATAAPAAAPDSTRYYMEEDGRGVGWFSVARASDAQGRTVYRGSGERPGSYKCRRFELVVAPDNTPVRSFVRLSAGGQSYEFATDYQKGKAVSTVKVGGQKMPVPPEKIADQVFVLPGNVPTAFAALSDFLAGKDASAFKAELKAFAPPVSEIPLSVAGLGRRAVPAGREQAEVRAFQLTLRVPAGRGGAGPRTLELELYQHLDGRFFGFKQGAVSAYPFPDGAVVEGPPRSYPEIAVRFVSGGDTLAGSLMLPAAAVAKEAAPEAPARRPPALVFVSGSGPSDRDQVVAGFPVFRKLAEQLAAAGYASLRYDDRGVEESGGDHAAATMEMFAGDATAAVAALRARPEIDPARVGILGHSEGAMLAPQISDLLAAAGQGPWCVVLLAGSAATGREINLEQFEHGLAQAGLDSVQQEQKRTLQHRVLAYLDGTATWESVTAMADSTDLQQLEFQKALIEGPWFRSFLAYSAAPYLSRLTAPVLILHGELDTQLPPHHGARLRELLKAAGHQRVSYVPARSVNHLFQKAQTGEVSEYAALEPDFAPGIVKQIVAFLSMCGGDK